MNLMKEIDAKVGENQVPFTDYARAIVAWVVRYLDVRAAVVALQRDDGLRVLVASSDDWMAPGLDLGALLPPLQNVLDSGSSLVLPDASTHPMLWPMDKKLDRIRDIIAVPLEIDGVTIGVVAVFDSSERGTGGDDLELVQLLSQRTADGLRAWAGGRAQHELSSQFGPGITRRAIFEKVLERELRLHERRGGSFELALVAGPPPDAVQEVIAGAAAPSRLMACVLSQGAFGIYKRDREMGASVHVRAVLDQLRARAPASAVGIVDLAEGGLAGFHAPEVLRLAERALARAAAESPVGATRRLLVADEPPKP
jgi:hypothetical protein